MIPAVLKRPATWSLLLFWAWHAVALALLGFGVAPTVMAGLVEGAVEGRVPAGILGTALALCLLPVASATLGLTRLRRRPEALLPLFYGLLAPGMSLLAWRLFVVRELTAGVAWLGLVMGLAMGSFAVGLLREAPRPGAPGLLLAGVRLAAALYVGLLLGPFVPGMATLVLVELLPNLAEAARESVSLGLGRGLFGLGLGLLFLAFVAMTATWWLAMPPAFAWLMGRSWLRACRASTPGAPAASLALSGVGLAVAVAGFAWTFPQPQERALALLAQPPQSDAARLALLDEAPALRAGLVNAALASWRYQGTEAAADGLTALYEEAWDLEREQLLMFQQAWNLVASPFLYRSHNDHAGLSRSRSHHAFVEDRAEAERRYLAFFDRPFQEAERGALLAAMAATWDADGAEAGLLDVGRRRVHLASQSITVAEHPGYAEVELAEVYVNQTHDDLEVLLHLSLPREAAVTGLWLGLTPDRARADAFVVAPRGAAQAVYVAERERRVDPALLEQVGPQQYRLRAYPVPAASFGEDEGQPLYLWLRYVTPPLDGAWPAPRLAEVRNLYWDGHTRREGLAVAGEDLWPASLPAADPALARPRVLEARLTEGSVVRATPLVQDPDPAPRGLDLGVILDTSLSMADRAEEVLAAVERLRALAEDNRVALVLTRSPFGGDTPGTLPLEDFEEPLWFGGDDLSRLIAEGAGLLPPCLVAAQVTTSEGCGPGLVLEDYDAVIVLTDAGGLIPDEAAPALSPPGPLWLVHLGGALPAALPDPVLDAIEASGGGAAASLDEALARVARSRAAPPGFIDRTEGLTWARVEGEGPAETPPALAALAARQLILAERRRLGEDWTLFADLLHGLAVGHGVVTPLSSMIVLVDDRQRQALAEASAAEDRFEREAEDGVEVVGPSPVAGLTATPEPGTWALLGVAAAALGARRRLRGVTRPR